MVKKEPHQKGILAIVAIVVIIGFGLVMSGNVEKTIGGEAYKISNLAPIEPQEIPECEPGETRQCGTTDVGACEYGIERCGISMTTGERHWGACTAVYPSDEVCDGLDNDCDGNLMLNEYDYSTSIEVCDGLDNDCGGEVDEGDVCGENLWLGHYGRHLNGTYSGKLQSCDSNGNCIYQGDKGAAITSVVVYDDKLWLGQNNGHLQSCDSGGVCIDHGDKGDPGEFIISMAVYDNKLWLGHYWGDFRSCDSNGNCIYHGNEGWHIHALGVFANKLWLGQGGGTLKSCTADGVCIDHGNKGTWTPNSMVVFDDKLWLGFQGTGQLSSCDSSGDCINHGNKGDYIHSMAVFDNKIWLGQDGGNLRSCDSGGVCINHGDKGDPIVSLAVF